MATLAFLFESLFFKQAFLAALFLEACLFATAFGFSSFRFSSGGCFATPTFGYFLAAFFFTAATFRLEDNLESATFNFSAYLFFATPTFGFLAGLFAFLTNFILAVQVRLQPHIAL